ncbi:GDP-mannose 4,6-dehydratase [Paraburkholderia sp. MMS20-SJTR3]|uniref:GDP-mannose 4,6-dehydratase n=1 Tax=Paraburkholderia sejongensis TaxID=2886946 RepID=A0ABS8JPI8_9BURK|nr:GDP-mannose 4,6-dehydratase [Paraburkholderia sp. MMS20-SJTR3]MCC8391803.1 GDP-mannose 4,6-dehydratase [Paraburkholderia sp. MMS20-SJTR3]
MKILITGAHGFTGRHLAARAAAEGHDVVALHANLTDKDALHDEVSRIAPDTVVHLAAISFVGHADLSAFYAVNVVGTTYLLDALAQLPTAPQRVLIASSANVYGNSEQSPLSEAHLPAPVNHYAMSKLAMEYMARTYAERLNIVITRPFNYTGAGQNVNFVIPKLAKHFAERAASVALGNLDVEREFNDVQLICDAYMALLAHGQAGETYNVCTGKPYTLREIIDTFEAITGHKMTIEVNPAFVRKNEVHRLCGNPDKLNQLLQANGVSLNVPTLRETLTRML